MTLTGRSYWTALTVARSHHNSVPRRRVRPKPYNHQVYKGLRPDQISAAVAGLAGNQEFGHRGVVVTTFVGAEGSSWLP